MLNKTFGRFINRRYFSGNAIDPQILEGWVRKSHRVGKMTFLHVNDGKSSQCVQAVVPKLLGRNFNVGSAVRLVGTWVPSKGSKQTEEFCVTQVEKMAVNQITVLRTDPEEMRSQPSLRVALPNFSSILRVRSKLNFATHRFFETNNFALVDTPVVTVNECEGAGEVFEVITDQDKNFFCTDKVFLSVSSQLHLEALICGLPRVYTIGTAFRAEKCLSSKHLSEFRMLEAECAFVDDLDRLCDIVQEYIRYVVRKSAQWKDDYHVFKGDDKGLLCDIAVDKSFPRISFNEAIDILRKKGSTVSARLSKQNEIDLVSFMNGPVFIQKYPANQKPFYMRVNEKNEAECFDLIVPVVGELAGGSIREYDQESLQGRCNTNELQWYFDLRSNGYPRSSGFGLGMERLMQSLFGIHNIKDTVAFPRWYNHCRC